MDQSDRYSQWLRVNPLENPLLTKAPQHQPERFAKYTEFLDESGNLVAFQLDDGKKFFLDLNGGWTDERGCYYNKDGEPDGWYVVQEKDGKTVEHYYDNHGVYMPPGAELTPPASEDEDEPENDDDLQQDGEHDKKVVIQQPEQS